MPGLFPVPCQRRRRGKSWRRCALAMATAAAVAAVAAMDGRADAVRLGAGARARASLLQHGHALHRDDASRSAGGHSGLQGHVGARAGAGSGAAYSTVNGTVEIGLCDKHLLCRDIWAAYVDQQAFCPPGNVMCQRDLAFRCTTRTDAYERRGCELEDCLEVRAMLVAADSCAQWFPEIVESSANRNPVENVPNPTQVMNANDEVAGPGATPRPLGATCVVGSAAETCASTCCGQRPPAPPLLDPRTAPPPDDARCVVPGTTRRGAFCRADCQCESGFCNIAGAGEPAQPPQKADPLFGRCELSGAYEKHIVGEEPTGGPRGSERETIGDFRTVVVPPASDDQITSS